jgi:hypothetical protein
VFRNVSALAIAVVRREFGFIISMTPVLLDFTGFINMGLSVLFEILRSVPSRIVDFLSYVVIRILSLPHSYYLEPSGSHFWKGIFANSDTLFKGSAQNNGFHLEVI